MKRLKSKFAAIERIRTQQEKVAAARMATAQQALQRSARTVEVSRQTLLDTVHQIEFMLQDSCEWSSMLSGQRQIDVDQLEVNQRQQEYNLCQQEADTAKQARTLAFQELKTVEEAAVRERAEYRKLQTASNLMVQMENFRISSDKANAPNQPAMNSRQDQS